MISLTVLAFGCYYPPIAWSDGLPRASTVIIFWIVNVADAAQFK